MNASTLPPAQGLVYLDAFRGAIMLLMASSGSGIPQVAKHFPDGAAWKFPGYHTLNFVPLLATMIFGLIAGRLLRSELTMAGKPSCASE